MRKAILITGHAGDGKTTLANRLSDYYNINTYALADPLKKLTDNLFRLFCIDAPHLKEDMRPYYQYIGTELCRGTFGDDIWCETLDKKASATNDTFIISDIRFLNEYTYFKNRYDVFVIRVYNPDAILRLNHVSEQEIEQIPNDFHYNIKTDSVKDVICALESFIYAEHKKQR